MTLDASTVLREAVDARAEYLASVDLCSKVSFESILLEYDDVLRDPTVALAPVFDFLRVAPFAVPRSVHKKIVDSQGGLTIANLDDISQYLKTHGFADDVGRSALTTRPTRSARYLAMSGA